LALAQRSSAWRRGSRRRTQREQWEGSWKPMLTIPRQMRQLFFENDAEVERLERERREYEAQLGQRGRSPHLSGDDRARMGSLKKLKLLVWDRIEAAITRRHEQMPRPAKGAPGTSGVE
jgi:hypothetical protein